MPSTPAIPQRRLGVVGIIIYNPDSTFQSLNEILHQFGNIIVSRQGLPYRERNLSIISLIVDGNTDDIGALTGKLGQLTDVSVKTAFAKPQIN